MIKTKLLPKRKGMSVCSALLFCLISFFTLANVAYAIDAKNAFNAFLDQGYHPMISVGVGAYISSDAGQSQNFPIQNPVTDSFYNYSTNQSAQAAALMSIFLGDEWEIAERNWLMQGGLEFTWQPGFNVNGRLTQGAQVVSQNIYTYKYNITTRQFLFDGKILYTYRQIFHPYIFGGIGASVNEASDYRTNVPPDLTFTKEYQSKNTTSFSYALGFGVEIDIHYKVRLGLGYRFTNFGQVSLGSAAIDGTSVPGTLSQNHLYANQLIAQLTMML
jgi:opacity protein-like surface antigen